MFTGIEGKRGRGEGQTNEGKERRWWGSGRGIEARDSKRCSKNQEETKKTGHKSRHKPYIGNYGQ